MNLQQTESTWVCTRSAALYVIASTLTFRRTPECMNKWISDSCAFSWRFFFLLDFLVQIWCDRFYFYGIIFYFMMFGCYLLEACFVLIRDIKGEDPDVKGCGKEIGQVEWEETVIRDYFNTMEKIYFWTGEIMIMIRIIMNIELNRQLLVFREIQLCHVMFSWSCLIRGYFAEKRHVFFLGPVLWKDMWCFAGVDKWEGTCSLEKKSVYPADG